MSDLDWGALRSACHRKAWREAWEIVGTDQQGDATVEELYIFYHARRARSVSSAMLGWRQASMPQPLRGASAWNRLSGNGLRLDSEYQARWARIKQIAGWKSQAAAQHDPHVMARRAAAVMRLAMASGMRITVGGREITGHHGWMPAADNQEGER